MFRADSDCPQLVRYRGLSLAIPSPFFEASLGFFQTDGRVLLRGIAFLLAGRPAVERPYQSNAAEFMQACRKHTRLLGIPQRGISPLRPQTVNANRQAERGVTYDGWPHGNAVERAAERRYGIGLPEQHC
jgi:hypothetical protein